MAQLRRRRLRRDALIFLGSLIAHIGVFFVAISGFRIYPPPPQPEQAVQVELLPPTVELVPPPTPTPPVPTPHSEPTPPTPAQTQAPTPVSPRPIAQPQPAPHPAVTATAPVEQTIHPTLAPTAKPANAPTPLAPPIAALAPGAPKAAPSASLTKPAVQAVAAPKLVLHKSRERSPLGPPVSIPGAVFAPPAQQQARAAGAPGGAGAPSGGSKGGGLPGGILPGFGTGLRGGLLGCANAAALHLSAEERAHCAELLGEGAKESPRMDPIGATRRAQLNGEAAREAATQEYLNSTPSGSEVRPIAGQPRALHRPQ